ncbi:uncharacterized protein CG45076 isoform X1 [Culicoides brevitarsis]|uniref:uncharacterized protein CG45076 isoform X1 n=1 Tax=Culicoides brevitarsis TaxID=469753 RepID=UPI00307B2CC4
MVYETDFYTTRRPYSRPTVSSYSVTKSTLKKPNPYLIKEESPDRENIDREKSRMTVKKIKKLRQKVREGAAKCEMIATKGYNFKNTQTKMPKIKMLCFDTPLRIIPGVGRVYSPNVYTYSTYLSTPYRHYTPISTYSYHLPTYSYDYSLPRSLYLPSAVPIRYYSRSSPVRVVTSPLTDYYSPLIYSVNVRPSVIHREMMRIEHKTRPRYGYDPTEDFLNSASAKEFEDDLRSIRTQTSRVLSRIHAPLPRARRAISCTPFSSYSDRELLDRVRGRSVVRDDIFTLANYAEPARHYTASRFLDPNRPSRKFTAPKPLEDPLLDVKAKQAERAKKLASLNEVDEIELEKIRAKRLDEQKMKAEKMANDAAEAEAQKIEAARREAARQLEEERKKEEGRKLAEERMKAEAAKAKEAAELAAKKAAEEEARLAAEKARAEEEAAAAEEARLAAEKARAEEEARLAAEKAEQERLAKEEEEKRLAEEAAERAEQERLAKEEEEKRLAEEAALLAAEEERLAQEAAEKAEQERIAKEEEEKKRLAEEQARLEEEAARIAEFEKVAKEEREVELARQAAELAEIARLEAEAIKLEQLEQEQHSENADNQIESEPVVEEPLTPAAAEDTKEDISEAHATAEETPRESEQAGEDTADEADPLE